MKVVKGLIISYLHGILIYVLVFYLVTANPDGTLPLRWNVLNVVWTISFLFFYPVLRLRLLKRTTLSVHMTSLTTKALSFNDESNHNASKLYRDSINPVMNKFDLQGHSNNRDDGFSLIVDFLFNGVLILISIPAGLFFSLRRLFNYFISKVH